MLISKVLPSPASQILTLTLLSGKHEIMKACSNKTSIAILEDRIEGYENQLRHELKEQDYHSMLCTIELLIHLQDLLMKALRKELS